MFLIIMVKHGIWNARLFAESCLLCNLIRLTIPSTSVQLGRMLSWYDYTDCVPFSYKRWTPKARRSGDYSRPAV